jgi:hypothetical protein
LGKAFDESAGRPQISTPDSRNAQGGDDIWRGTRHGRHGGARLGCYNRRSLRLRREGEAP